MPWHTLPTVQQQGNNDEKLELQQVKRTYGRNVFPQKDATNTIDHLAVLSDAQTIQDDSTDSEFEPNSDESEVFQGFVAGSSPDIESHMNNGTEADHKMDVLVIIGGPSHKTELTGNRITAQVRITENSIIY